MGTTTIRPTDGLARRAAVERRVFEAVENLLAHGASYPELSVAAIAAAAGIARSTFYVHFADKTDLLVRLAGETTADIFAAAYEWTDGTADVGDAAANRQSLESTCARIVADYRSHRPVLEAVQAALGYDPVVAEFWTTRIDAFAEHAATRLAQAQVGGLVAPEMDLQLTASMAAWAIERTVARSVAASSSENDDALAAALARGLWLLVFGDSPVWVSGLAGCGES